jgi:hypothetical protein
MHFYPGDFDAFWRRRWHRRTPKSSSTLQILSFTQPRQAMQPPIVFPRKEINSVSQPVFSKTARTKVWTPERLSLRGLPEIPKTFIIASQWYLSILRLEM